jgi:putative addiction module killer protein
MVTIRQTRVFADWLAGLRDREARARIAARIERIGFGLLGDVKPVGAGVSEARIPHGPGYRIYFVQRGSVLIVLLCGGDKASQRRDIARAHALAAELED